MLGRETDSVGSCLAAITYDPTMPQPYIHLVYAVLRNFLIWYRSLYMHFGQAADAKSVYDSAILKVSNCNIAQVLQDIMARVNLSN